jgi:hypothetical protein
MNNQQINEVFMVIENWMLGLGVSKEQQLEIFKGDDPTQPHLNFMHWLARNITANNAEGPCGFTFACAEYHDKCQKSYDTLKAENERMRGAIRYLLTTSAPYTTQQNECWIALKAAVSGEEGKG